MSYPPQQFPPEAGSSEGHGGDQTDLKKRMATLYDAVAGRISGDGFGTSERRGRKHDGRAGPHRPDEVLFRRENAPARYVESDYYRNVGDVSSSPDKQLPDSDLLRALHAYIAGFYARSEHNPDARLWECMDETALIALGILVEEAAREILGVTGDLALMEAGEEAEEESEKSTVESVGDESAGSEDEEKDGSSRIHSQMNNPLLREESRDASSSMETE